MAERPTGLYDFSSDTGIVIPDTDDVRAAVAARFVEIFGPNCDTSEETHVGRFIDEITELVVQTTGVNAQNANQFNLNYATGTFLDNLGAAFGVARLKAAKSSVAVKLTCSQPNVTIPAGTVFASEDEYEFALTADVTVTEADAQTSGGVTVYVGEGTAQAVADGRIYCLAGTLTEIKTAVAGLVSVVNPTGAEPGRAEETDAHYRSRIRKARATGAASPSAILNALYALRDANGNPLVGDAVALENGHAYPVVKGGIALPAHSIYVCVTGDDGSGTSDNLIADAIYRTKTAGADYTTTTVSSALAARRKDITVTDEATGVESTVSFFRPVLRGLTVNVTADVSGYTGTDAKQAVTAAVQDYLATEGIGAEITEETVVTAIAERVGAAIRVKELSLAYDGAAVGGVKLSAGEAFTTQVGTGALVVVVGLV